MEAIGKPHKQQLPAGKPFRAAGSHNVEEIAMKKIQMRQVLLMLSLGVALLALPAAAQKRMGNGKVMPNYDPATEITVQGIVEEVLQISGPMEGMGRMHSMGGTHLSLKTDKETLDVHIAPSHFLEQSKFAFAKGDQVEITGSKVKVQGSEAFLAREVKKGDKALTLRDARGVPRWSMGQGRP